jgi:hypothetical protein
MTTPEQRFEVIWAHQKSQREHDRAFWRLSGASTALSGVSLGLSGAAIAGWVPPWIWGVTVVTALALLFKQGRLLRHEEDELERFLAWLVEERRRHGR